jgi:hypothetical protein
MSARPSLSKPSANAFAAPSLALKTGNGFLLERSARQGHPPPVSEPVRTVAGTTCPSGSAGNTVYTRARRLISAVAASGNRSLLNHPTPRRATGNLVSSERSLVRGGGPRLFATFARRVAAVALGLFPFFLLRRALSCCGQLGPVGFRSGQGYSLVISLFLGISFQFQPVALATLQRGYCFELSFLGSLLYLCRIIVLWRLLHFLEKQLLGCGSRIAAFSKIDLFQLVTYSYSLCGGCRRGFRSVPTVWVTPCPAGQAKLQSLTPYPAYRRPR